jgi:hypothetical protein
MGNLTKDQVQDLSAPGRYSDGDGLILKIGPSGGKSWILRVQVNGRRRDIGLGDSQDLSLRAARAAAADLRKLARAGIDPLEERKKQSSSFPRSRRPRSWSTPSCSRAGRTANIPISG